MNIKLTEWLLHFYSAWNTHCSALLEEEGKAGYNKIKAELERFEDWTPTAKNINALPYPIRNYIADLEMNADPSSMVRENVLLRDTIKALEKKIEILEKEEK